jgi:hypothetical protein
MQRVALAVLGVLVVAVGGIGWLALSYRTMPVSNLGVAYVMGARVALTADHVHAIAKGQTPTIEFRRKARDSSNKYVWQRGKIERPAACLYYEADATKGGAIGHPGYCPDQHRTSRAGDQLYFSVEPGDALRIGDLAGCVGGPWGGLDRTDLALAFFEVTPSGEFAVIR